MSESLRDIRIFVAAYEERSFTAAAIREHATQSGVSQHIRKLEEGFRVKLFSRAKGQVAPTPAADAYYGRCIQILRNIESGSDAIKSFAGVSGDVFVGPMPTMTRATLAPSIQRVVSEHPNIRHKTPSSTTCSCALNGLPGAIAIDNAGGVALAAESPMQEARLCFVD